MAGCTDHLPGEDESVSLATAQEVAEAADELLDPTTDLYLDHGFEVWDERFVAWRECGPEGCGCHIDFLRYSLEDVAAVQPHGSLILDALKLALSAFVLARENPYFEVVEGQRNLDIDPVIRRAIALLKKGARQGVAQIEYAPETMEALEDRREKRWLGDLIDRAQGTPTE